MIIQRKKHFQGILAVTAAAWCSLSFDLESHALDLMLPAMCVYLAAMPQARKHIQYTQACVPIHG